MPTAPGVYLMREESGEIFYIGKAKNLRSRIRSYLRGQDSRAFVALLDHLLDDIEVILTESEKEAMLLENELIKKYQPRFNVKLTDDKRYLCLRLSKSHTYPRLELVRRFGKDKAHYFGPFHSASAIRETLRIVNRHFQLRTCSDQVLISRKRPCLQYQIKRCLAPCVFDLSDGGYAQKVGDVVSFLEGRHRDLLAILEERMQRHAEKLQFEVAAQIRDQRRAVKRSMERQGLVSSDFVNRDVVGLYREGPSVEIHVMHMRQGRPIGAQRFTLQDTELPTGEILADFGVRYYANDQDPRMPPDEILFPPDMEWTEALEQVLREHFKKSLRILVPQRGDKKRLITLAIANARQAFQDKKRERGAAKTAAESLQKLLRFASSALAHRVHRCLPSRGQRYRGQRGTL